MKFKDNYWLITGFAFMLGITVYGIIGTFNIEARFLLNFLSIIDWIAASIIYFFFGAVIGHIIDSGKNKKLKHPLWFYLTIALFFLSIIIVAIISDKSNVSTTLILLFPLAYGIFFSSQTFSIFVPIASMYWKLLYNISLTAIFIAWIYLTMHKKEQIARILLIILFLIFIVGFIGCATALA
jgi:hypothetical protein